MIAAIDGRPLPPVEETARRRSRSTTKTGATSKRVTSGRPATGRTTASTSLAVVPAKPAAARKATTLSAVPAPAPDPPERHPIEAVIFDLDGVIVDSEIWWDEVRQAFAAEHERTWTVDDRHAVMGANSRQWSRTMRRRLELDLPASEIERAIVDGMVERYAREGAPVIDGAVPAVRRIAATHRVALASSSHRAVIDAALAATGLTATFPVVVSSDEVAHGKPLPDVFLEAARRLGADPDRTLVVEDSLNGLRAGRAAGMTTVLVPNASVPPAAGSLDQADLVLARLADLDPDRLTAATAPGATESIASPAPSAAPSPAPSGAPADTIHPWRRWLRTTLTRVGAWVVCRALFRPRLVGRDRLPGTPAIYCFNHLSWIDPFVLMATLPMRPRARCSSARARRT